MTALWTSADAAAATGGRASRAWEATGVSIDSRTLQPGDLFVALSAARDGHDFVADAFARGAAAAMVTHRPEGVAEDAPLLVVPDVLAGLTEMGRAGRARLGGQVIGVTGSVGKTSTKDMLRAMLAGQGRVHAAQASYNNHWGVPLTLALAPPDADFAIIEIGMNQPGEIAPLARLARPHVALVTTVAPAHLAAFGTVEAIAREKATICDGLEPGGAAVLPEGLATTAVLTGHARARGMTIRSFGSQPPAEWRLVSAIQRGRWLVAEADTPRGPLLFKLNVAGRHFAMNALGALAAADAAGADAGRAAMALADWAPPAGRGTHERLWLDLVERQSFELIDDAFNANPTSMGAALEMLAATEVAVPPPPPPPRERDERPRLPVQGRRIAILGDMLELGPDEHAMHAALADHPALARVDIVHCVGPRMRHLWKVLPARQRGRWTETAEALGAQAHRLVHAGDVILVKGSKGSRVSRVVDALRNLGQGDAADGAADSRENE